MRVIALGLAALAAALAPGCDAPPNSDATPSPPAVTPSPTAPSSAGLVAIEPYEGRPGDADAGWRYLIYGDYSGSGVPYDIWTETISGSGANFLQREGDNAALSPAYVAFDAPNGVRVVGSTCLGCHMSEVNGEEVIGLGDSFINLTNDLSAGLDFFRVQVSRTYGQSSAELEAFEAFAIGYENVAPYSIAPFPGVNPAFMLEEAAVAYREPLTLTWVDDPLFVIPTETLASDTPAWWNVKKKNSWYYNGMGRGDKARLAMQISVIGLVDPHQGAGIDEGMIDLVAYLESLEAPTWPWAIDEARATQGQAIFEQTCSRCHGTYGEDETYPNLLVGLDVVGTDPAYATYFVENQGLASWFNDGWYGEDGLSWLEPTLAYVAPPLDGVWATAPYLHNASVPSLEVLLKSSARPEKWHHNEEKEFDQVQVGWAWAKVEGDEDPDAYDTTLAGYGNGGHTFGDHLSDDDRGALIEYLKTL